MSHTPPWRHMPSRGPQRPVLVSIPHTGTAVPADIAAQFVDPRCANWMTDWHLHDLYDFLPGLGVDVLHATYHRFVADLNRPPNAAPLYPGRFETGVVPLQTFQGEDIWRVPPDAAQIQERLTRYHRPYHEELERRLRETVARFGRCLLIDAHSVESRANRLHGTLVEDVFLGNRDGASCPVQLLDIARAAFAAQGLQVSLNTPYKGGYITAHYCSIPGVQTLQIEMCQRLYMLEGQPEGAVQSPMFVEFKRRLRPVLTEILDAWEQGGVA